MELSKLSLPLVAGAIMMMGVASTASAQGGYAGGGFTHWNYDHDSADELKSSTATLRAGYDHSEHLAIEAHLSAGGDDSFSYSSAYENIEDKFELEFAASVFMKVKFPITPRFRAYALGGLTYLQVEEKVSYSNPYGSASSSNSGNDTNLAGGLGAEIDATRNISVGADYIRHSFGQSDYDWDTMSLVGTYSF